MSMSVSFSGWLFSELLFNHVHRMQLEFIDNLQMKRKRHNDSVSDGGCAGQK